LDKIGKFNRNTSTPRNKDGGRDILLKEMHSIGGGNIYAEEGEINVSGGGKRE